MIATQYIPGVCNIGEAEIKQRQRVGWIGLVVTIAAWGLLTFLPVPAVWKLLLFFPAAMSASGFIQAFTSFCAGFGMRGVFNFGTQLYKTDNVTQASFRAKDKRKAQLIFVYSILIGLVVAYLAFLL